MEAENEPVQQGVQRKPNPFSIDFILNHKSSCHHNDDADKAKPAADDNNNNNNNTANTKMITKGHSQRYKSFKKQIRTAFSQDQIQHLENEFHKNHYLTINKRVEMSVKLSLSENQIKIWFQNRRTKLKRNMYLIEQQHKRQNMRLFEATQSSNRSFVNNMTTSSAQQQQHNAIITNELFFKQFNFCQIYGQFN
jgi:hypothetical protein